MLLKKHPISSIAALTALLFAQNILAADASSLTDALTGGKASANLQYRYENVQQAFRQTANASTLRLRLGYETAAYNGFGAMVEAESLRAVGSRTYNSTANGQTQYAVVADPEATEINQAYLSYSGFGNTVVKYGRQRLILDNARFIGNVGWRQNEQTFDAFTLVNKSVPSTTITAGYITNVNRVFSDNALTTNTAAQQGNHRMRSPIFNVSYKGFSFAEVAGYYYDLNYDPAAVPSLKGNTAKTLGIRLNGSTAMGNNKLLYTAEFAEQRDGDNNPTDFKDTYTFLEGGVDVTNIGVFKLGYEVLGTDVSARTKATGALTQRSFATPLATLHAFNGWADMFLATPNSGLKDAYISAATKQFGINFGAVYHDYTADKTYAAAPQSSLGTEWNLVASKAFDKNYTVGVKYAEYKTKDSTATMAAAGKTFTGNVNTRKAWLWGEFKF